MGSTAPVLMPVSGLRSQSLLLGCCACPGTRRRVLSVSCPDMAQLHAVPLSTDLGTSLRALHSDPVLFWALRRAWVSCRLLPCYTAGAAEGRQEAMAAQAGTGGAGATVDDIAALLQDQSTDDAQPLRALPSTSAAVFQPAAARSDDSVDMPGTLERSHTSQSGGNSPAATAPAAAGLPADAQDGDGDAGTTHLTAHDRG